MNQTHEKREVTYTGRAQFIVPLQNNKNIEDIKHIYLNKKEYD